LVCWPLGLGAGALLLLLSTAGEPFGQQPAPDDDPGDDIPPGSGVAQAPHTATPAQQHLAFLAEASRELAASLDYTVTLHSLARLSVPTLADWCIVDVLEEHNQIRRVAMAHHDPAREPLLDTLRQHYPPRWDSPMPLIPVLRSGRSTLLSDLSPQQVAQFASDTGHVELLHKLGTCSVLVVPLIARGAIVGALTLIAGDSGRRYHADDRTLAEDLAHRAALAVDNARLYRDAQMARTEASALAGRSTFLAEVSRILASSLDRDATLREVANLTVPFLTDWCIIDLLQEDGSTRRIEVREGTRSSPYQRMVEIEHSNLIARVLHTGRSEFYPELPDDIRTLMLHDVELPHESGTARPHAVIIAPLLARKPTLGAITCISLSPERRYGLVDLTLIEDLAHRVALALDNARLYHKLQEAVRIRDEFLSIASHELKTPLTSLLGYARLLRGLAEGTTQITERERRGVRIIAEQADRLNKLISALLDISRIRTGRLSIEHEPVDIVALTRRVVDEVQVMLEQHHIELYTTDATLFVEGDMLRLEQVLQNLLQNAIKYSPEGGSVRVRLERRERWACLLVIDQGIGIPDEALSQMFQPFYRAPNTLTRPIVGMGIGLYVVKEIVMLHSGEVDVVSAEGEGSTFLVRLPLLTPP
jgi:signal transduction histidine kinase